MSADRWQYRAVAGDLLHRIDPTRGWIARTAICGTKIPKSSPSLGLSGASSLESAVAHCQACDAQLSKARAVAKKERLAGLASELARDRERRAKRRVAAAADQVEAAASRSQSVTSVSGGLPTLGKHK